MQEPLIFLGIPTRGQVSFDTMAATHRMGRTKVHCLRGRACSILTYGFNQLWVEALNERKAGLTHFVMMHDDICPISDGWLDTLLAEHEECGADITHVVCPIKDSRGSTSTAFMDPSTRFMRRLVMKEACGGIPKTFDAQMAGYPAGYVILPNTGLWICDFTKPWVEEICFTIRDRINKNADGTFTAQCFSEDWHFGTQALKLGLKVFGTTGVKIVHKGPFDWPNFEPWGEWKSDPDTACFNPAEDSEKELVIR